MHVRAALLVAVSRRRPRLLRRFRPDRHRLGEAPPRRRDGRTVENPVVRIENGVVVSVGTRARRARSVTCDLGDVTLLPGLTDCHVHLVGGEEQTPYQSLLETTAHAAIEGAVNARKTLEAGFTTVRDLGGARLRRRRAARRDRGGADRRAADARRDEVDLRDRRARRPQRPPRGRRRAALLRRSRTGPRRSGRRSARTSSTAPTGSRCS